MKIRAIPPAGTIMVLGDDDDARAMISGYDRETPMRVQPSTPANADYSTSYFRGRGQPRRSWITEYCLPSAKEGFEFAETHGDEVPGLCILEITSDLGVMFFDAILQSVKCLEQAGPTAKFQYVFNVGEGRRSK